MRPWLERLLDPSAHIAHRLQDSVVDPTTRFLTRTIESFGPPMTAIVLATLLQASLPSRVGQTRWIFVGLSIVLLLVFAVVNPRQIERRHKPLRGVMLVLVAALSLGNAIAGAELVIDLVNSEGIRDPGTLLRTGGAIWLTNVIVFSLWYWLFDRGGPYARLHDESPVPPAFLFPQMQDGTPAPVGWRPEYIDYLYLSFTNAISFAASDVTPPTRWAKTMMMLQSAVSVAAIALVVARAVNILG